MSLLFRVAAPLAALALALCACSASADIGAPATPQPAPTPQPPQVIVIQSPVQAQPTPPASARDDGFLLVAILAFGACLIAGAGTIGFALARLTSQSASSAPQSYSQPQPGYYTVELTYEEAAVIAQWRERQKRIARDEAMRYIGEVRR